MNFTRSSTYQHCEIVIFRCWAGTEIGDHMSIRRLEHQLLDAYPAAATAKSSVCRCQDSCHHSHADKEPESANTHHYLGVCSTLYEKMCD